MGHLLVKRHPPIAAERLRRLFTYNPDTGVAIWLLRTPDMFAKGKHTPETYCKIWNGRFANKSAGTPTPKGYIVIYIDKRQYKLHVLAWCYMTGEWPKDQIDHKNTDKTNNKWLNLREATDVQNRANEGLRINNTSGFKGVSAYKGKFVARIGHNNEVLNLGTFITAKDASIAYEIKASELHGEFARTT